MISCVRGSGIYLCIRYTCTRFVRVNSGSLAVLKVCVCVVFFFFPCVRKPLTRDDCLLLNKRQQC